MVDWLEFTGWADGLANDPGDATEKREIEGQPSPVRAVEPVGGVEGGAGGALQFVAGSSSASSKETEEPSEVGSTFPLEALSSAASALLEENPFGANGFLARLGEKMPFANSGLQRLYAAAGDEESLRRARGEDPVGPDGYLTQVAEHIPLLNTVMQERFRTLGEEEALRRAQERDPIGSHGYLTKAFEHIPGISDGVMVIHKLKGDDHAYERARATSLTHLLSKDGALTRLAELMPVSHLFVAAVHEASGHRDEAMRALDFFQSWAEAFRPDSPFARVAELIPGTDAVAFAFHVQGGHYAQALRSLTKTSWVNVSVDKVVMTLSCPSLSALACCGLEVHSIDVQPRQFSLLVGVRDVLTTFLIVDRAGHRRSDRENADLERIESQGRQGAFDLTKDLLQQMVHDKVEKQMHRFADNLPGHLDWLVLALNNRLPSWRAESLFLRATLPPQLPRLPRPLATQAQQALLVANISWGRLPAVRPIRLRSRRPALLAAECAAGLGCLPVLAGAKSGGAVCCCAAGLACAAFELGRAAVRWTARWIDSWNSESWTDVVGVPQPHWSWHEQRPPGVAAAASSSSGIANSAGASGRGAGEDTGSLASPPEATPPPSPPPPPWPTPTRSPRSSPPPAASPPRDAAAVGASLPREAAREASIAASSLAAAAAGASIAASRAEEAAELRRAGGVGASSSASAPPSPPWLPPVAASLPSGVLVELQTVDVARLGRRMRAYYLDHALSGGCCAKALLAAEPLLRLLARSSLITEDHGAAAAAIEGPPVVPFVLEIDLDAWAIELEEYSFDLWLPAMRFALIFHFELAEGVPSTKRVFMALPDELLDNVVQGLQDQLPDWDLRELDPRFAGFRKPAHARTRLFVDRRPRRKAAASAAAAGPNAGAEPGAAAPGAAAGDRGQAVEEARFAGASGAEPLVVALVAERVRSRLDLPW